MSDVGPDRIIPTDKIRTWKRDGAVKIRQSEGGYDFKPKSIPSFFKERCQAGGDHPAVTVKRDNKWITWTYKDYYQSIKTVAKAFISLGLDPLQSVCIYGFNAPEWFFSSVAAVFAGGFSTGLYPTNSAETNKFIMNDSRCNILVCEDEAAVEKMWTATQDVDTLRKIVQYTGNPKRVGVIGWEELMKIGNQTRDEVLEERLKNIAINQCACLIYTSGTTGNPKGVMLSHDNILFTSTTAGATEGFREKKERLVSFLPLSHIAALLADIYTSVSCLFTVYVADKNALKGTLLDTLKEAKPTILFAVPRVWEKFMEGMLDKGKSVKGLKKKIATASKEAGLAHHMEGKDGLMYKVGKKVVYAKVREALGLDQCWGFFYGAAPIGPETLKYFLSLDIVLNNVYGMSETSGPHIIETPQQNKFGTAGKTMPGLKTRLNNPNGEGEGEIWMWGRDIMMGYLNREDKTTEDLDDEGWLHSGDMGYLDKDGFYHITGRIKELLITAGGENVAPIPIEENIKTELPIISNAILIGDKKKFLSVFLTFRTVVDQNTMVPSRNLTQAAIDWCSELGRHNIRTVDDILRGPDPVIMKAIQDGIDRVNQKAVSNACRVQKWTVLPMDVSIPGGELGPTMKLKRFAFNKKYAATIDKLYC